MDFKSALHKGAEIGVALTCVATFILAGCGGGGGGATGGTTGGTTSPVLTGVVYPIVSGLQYQTNTTSGVVSATGSFPYQTNDSVTFSVGAVQLNTVQASSLVTPLPLDNSTASTNMVRLLTALNTGSAGNGIVLPQIAAASATVAVNWQSQSSVAAALTTLSSTAILPAASSVQVTTTLANANATALNNLGKYGTTYNLLGSFDSLYCTYPQAPKGAVLTLTSQPNWVTGAMTGTVALTLSDNSTLTVPFTSNGANFTSATGNKFQLALRPNYAAKSRILGVVIEPVPARNPMPAMYCSGMLRDNTQHNTSPVISQPDADACQPPPTGWTSCPLVTSVAPGQPQPPACTPVRLPTATKTCTYSFQGWGANILGVSLGGSLLRVAAGDVDGFIPTQSWSSTKGGSGTGTTFNVTCNDGEDVSLTLNVTDDEGATATKTWKACSKNGSASSSGSTGGTAGSLTASGGVSGTLGMNATNLGGPSTVSGTVTTVISGWTTSPNTAATPVAGDTLLFVNSLTNTNPAGEYLIIQGGLAATNAYATDYALGASGAVCYVSGVAYGPTCASLGITYNRSGGTITFKNTPFYFASAPALISLTSPTFLFNGTLSFTPY